MQPFRSTAGEPTIKVDSGDSHFPEEVKHDAIELMQAALPPHTTISFEEFKVDFADATHDLNEWYYKLDAIGVPFHRGPLLRQDVLYTPLPVAMDHQELSPLIVFRWIVKRAGTELYQVHMEMPQRLFDQVYPANSAEQLDWE